MNEKIIDSTADSLRDIADAMDNPDLRPMGIEAFIEKVSIKTKGGIQ